MQTDKIYRFKFSDEIVNLLNQFSKLHKFTDQKEYKEKWNSFLEENKEIIEIESKRLCDLGYTGDIKDKMYKSARYYFRKKSDCKKEPVKRKQYKSIDREILENMDLHIQRNIDTDNYTPAIGFDDFSKLFKEIIDIEISNFKNNDEIELEEVKNKIKKTYKNRYFLYSRNMNAAR